MDEIEVSVAEPYLGVQIGTVRLRVHDQEKCAGQPCVIHNPSDHHMQDWKLNWRADRGIMERLCPAHGIGHPDPDDLNRNGVHGCCGCCVPPERRLAHV
jgi:hypothetical protein